MLSELRKILHEQNKNFNKRENIQKNQTEIWKLKNVITEQKNSLYGFQSRLDQVEERISELKDKPLEIMQSKER